MNPKIKKKVRPRSSTTLRSVNGVLETQRARPMAWLFSRTRRAVRLSTYLFFVSLGGGMLAARSGYGQMKDSAMHLGEELLRLTDSGMTGDFYRLRLNGELLNVTSATTNLTVTEVLDHFQEGCSERADNLKAEFVSLKEALRPDAPPSYAPGYPGIGVTRTENEGGGIVLCFAQGGATDKATVFRNLQEFATTGDLSKVGNLRYIAAKRAVEGGALVVAAWTDGEFMVSKMFPSEGDAPGSDIENAFRPNGTKRIFSAYAEGAPYGIRVYEANRPPVLVLDEYDREMELNGWMAISAFDGRMSNARAFSRGSSDLIIVAEPTETGAVISITEMTSR